MKRRVAAIVVASLWLAACGNDKESTAATETTDPATQTYGYGPIANPAVVYQPDVIIVGGGPAIIRSASADGLVWVIDGNAPNARTLQPGKILLATSRAAGRVMSVEPRGNDLAVTLGPVHLGDIIKDANLRIDLDIQTDSLLYQQVPALPGMYRDLTAALDAGGAPVHAYAESVGTTDAGELLLRLSPIQFVLADQQPADNLPLAAKSSAKVSVRGWEIEPSLKHEIDANAKDGDSIKQRVGLKIQKTSSGLKAGIDLAVLVNKLHLKTETVYVNGKVDPAASIILLEGVEGFEMDILSGIQKAYGENQKVRIEVPIEFVKQIPPSFTYGVPMVFQVKFKFLFETALGGNNATLKAAGNYAMKGPIGVEHGKMITPTVTETKPVIDNVSGISLGVSGMVFTQETRFLLGLGVPAYFNGPYAKFTTAAGVTKAADVAVGLAAPSCRSTTLKFDAGAGWGFQLSLPELGMLTKLLGPKVKTEWEAIEHSATFYRKDMFNPDIPACRF